LIPELTFGTNDCVQLIIGIKDYKNFPLLLKTRYGNGKLYILTVPDNPGDFYQYPAEVLNALRHIIMENTYTGPYVSFEGPAQIGLFTYDNRTFVIESFLPHNQQVQIIINKENAVIEDLVTGFKLTGKSEEGKTFIPVDMPPSQYYVFSYA
jgi:hypothetical protein